MRWSSGGTQHLNLVKVCQGLVGMGGLATSLSLQENVLESPAVRVGVTNRTGVTQTPCSGPSVSERQKLPGRLKRSFFSQEISSCLFISTSRQINSISNSICQEEEELLE